MRNLIVLLLLSGIISTPTVAQILPIDDIIACGEYILPPIQGANLSTDLKYFLDGDISGTPLYVGDTIDFSTQLYMYDCNTGFDECYYVNVIVDFPEIRMQDTLVGCTLLFLPFIEGDNISSDAAYYTARDKMGIKHFPGALISESQWLYIYDGVSSCISVDSTFVLIVPEMYMEDYRDTLHCSQYALLPLEGINLPANRYYSDINSNEIYHPNDVLFSSTSLVAIADSMGCELRDTFTVSIDSLYIEYIPDTIWCGSFYPDDFEFVSSAYNIYYKYEDTDWLILDSVRHRRTNTDQFICFKDSLPGTNCSVEECFYTTFLNVDEFPNDPSRGRDTINICKNTDFNLRETPIVNFDYADYFYLEEGSNFGGFFPASSLPLNEYTVYAVQEAGSVCDDIDTITIHLILTEDCNEIDEYSFFMHSCNQNYEYSTSFLYDPNGTLLYGGLFFDEDFQNTFEDYSRLDYQPLDTTIYWYIYAFDNGQFDTVKITLLDSARQQLDPVPTQIIGPDRLCNGDSLSISYSTAPNDTILHWSVELWEIGLSNTFIANIGALDPIRVYYSNDSISVVARRSLNSAFNVYKSNTDYMVIFPLGYTFFFSNNCIVDSSADTIYFSTHHNTTHWIQDVLCAGEEIKVEDEVFNINNPVGNVLLQGAGSNGCDSTVIVNLEFDDSNQNLVSRVFCDEDEFMYFDCIRYDIDNPTGGVVMPGAARNGCDSLITIVLDYVIAEDEMLVFDFCKGDTFDLNGIIYTESAELWDTLYSVLDCDSIYLYQFLQFSEDNVPLIRQDYDCVNKTYSLSVDNISENILWSTGDTIGSLEGVTATQLILFYNPEECRDSLTVDLVYADPLVTGVDEYKVGENTEILIDLVANQGVDSYRWTNSSILSCTDCLNPIAKPIESTVLELEYSDINGCLDTFDISIRIIKRISDFYTLCLNDTININNTDYFIPGTYSDTLRAVDNCDSIITELIIESILPLSIELVGDTVNCDSAINQWEVLSTHTDITLDGITVDKIFSIDGSGIFSISGTDINGCVTEQIIQTYESTLAVVIDPVYGSLLAGSETIIEPDYIGDIVSYLWSPSEGLACSDCPYPTLNSTIDRVYNIEITDIYGCNQNASVVTAFNNASLYLPNIISRNSTDLDNRHFYLQSGDAIVYQLKVYDRWGNLIFNRDSIISNDRDAGWLPAQDLEQGVYIYVIYDEDQAVLHSGSITLL